MTPRHAQPVVISPFLAVAPPSVESQYWARFRAFDLVNCVIPILYFGKVVLSTWCTPALLAVYSGVLLLKLLHAALLLRAPGEGLRWRRAILWTERVVRTLVSMRAVAYGQPAKGAAAGAGAGAGAPPAHAARVLLLNSGFTIACWNVFCLPLDFPSQVMLTGVFVLSTLPASLHEAHRVMAGPVASAPRAVWLHARLRSGVALLGEALLRGSLAPPPPGAAGAAAAAAAAAARGGGGGGSAVAGAVAAAAAGLAGEAAAAAAGEAAAAGLASAAAAAAADLQAEARAGGLLDGAGALLGAASGATAGGGFADVPLDAATQLSAVASCCFVLFACGALPLWVAYHLERVHKQQWLRSQPQLLWLNAPPPARAGRWPGAAEAGAQLGALLVASLAVSEVCVAMWSWLSMPVWSSLEAG